MIFMKYIFKIIIVHTETIQIKHQSALENTPRYSNSENHNIKFEQKKRMIAATYYMNNNIRTQHRKFSNQT